jgi:allophanate hydrolase
MEIAVVGAHLTDHPLNKDLTTLNATFSQRTTTSPAYKLYELPNTTPAKPGLVRNPQGGGSRIEVEIWNLPLSNVGAFLSTIDSPLGIGSVELEDGRWAKGFICEGYGVVGARDVSGWGGWRAYRAECAEAGDE